MSFNPPSVPLPPLPPPNILVSTQQQQNRSSPAGVKRKQKEGKYENTAMYH